MWARRGWPFASTFVSIGPALASRELPVRRPDDPPPTINKAKKYLAIGNPFQIKTGLQLLDMHDRAKLKGT